MPDQRERLTGSGAYRHRATVQVPGAPASDGDGGYTETWVDLVPPTWAVSVGAGPRVGGEAPMVGTTITTMAHLLRGRYRADVTTHTRLLLEGRVFNVQTVRNLDERNRTLEVIATEVGA